MPSEEFQILETEIRTVKEAAAWELQKAAGPASGGSAVASAPLHSNDMEEDLDDEQAQDLAEALTETIADETGEARAARGEAAKSRVQKQSKVVAGIVAKKGKLKRGSCG